MFVTKFLRAVDDFGIDQVVKFLCGHEFDHAGSEHIVAAIQVQRVIIERVIDFLNSTSDPVEVFQICRLLQSVASSDNSLLTLQMPKSLATQESAMPDSDMEAIMEL